ncbi:MAG: zinc-ribbon domain-containing protein [Marinobacter sp.]|nr:zinc-ribbon domain-containing protein [Marinobacter sp.]
MTQSSLQTRCPNCDTRFRVTDEQLSIAKGKVRCGNCMEVFNAVDHQVKPAAAPATPLQPTPPATPDTESADSAGGFSADDDFVFADNPEEDAEEGRYAGSRMTFSEDELSDSFRSIEKGSTSEFDAEDDRTDDNIDESWAEAMLADDDISGGHNGLSVTREPAPRETPDNEPQPEIEPSVRSETDTEQRNDQPPPEDAQTTPTDSNLALEPTSGDYQEQMTAEKPGAAEAEAEEPLTTHQLYSDLRREPVSVHRSSGGRVRTILWSLVVLALIGVLVAQVTWFQFDRLSAIPELRPFYEKGCELAGCELTPLIDVDAIQSRKLVVRTDPNNRSQLLVEAVIINRATFSQPFPAIALTFSNLNGDVVAQSVFTPDEYIAGEGKELTTMPMDTPVRIAISIRDPGRDAVNYNIAFRAYNPQ